MAKSLLNDKVQDGSFLVRAAYESPGDYTLSVRLVNFAEQLQKHTIGSIIVYLKSLIHLIVVEESLLQNLSDDLFSSCYHF